MGNAVFFFRFLLLGSTLGYAVGSVWTSVLDSSCNVGSILSSPSVFRRRFQIPAIFSQSHNSTTAVNNKSNFLMRKGILCFGIVITYFNENVNFSLFLRDYVNFLTNYVNAKVPRFRFSPTFGRNQEMGLLQKTLQQTHFVFTGEFRNSGAGSQGWPQCRTGFFAAHQRKLF